MLRIAIILILLLLLCIILMLIIKKGSEWLSKPWHLWGMILLILVGFGFFMLLAMQESGEKIPYTPYEKRQINGSV